MKLKDIILERFSKDIKPAELKTAHRKVLTNLKRGLKVWMNQPTVRGNVEFELAKALKLRVIDIRGGGGTMAIDKVINDLVQDLHGQVVKLRKKSGQSFVNINE
jgi:hypothetical protein